MITTTRGKSKSSCASLQKQERVMDIVERLRQSTTSDLDAFILGELAADEIEQARLKKKIAVKWIKELLDFLEFIYNHPEFENSLKAYEWIMFQIEMIMAKYNEPIGEDR